MNSIIRRRFSVGAQFFLMALGLFVTSAFADDIERVVLGQPKSSTTQPWAGLGFTKVKTINGVTYGLTRHKDAVGNFEKITIDRSYDGGYNWQGTPNTVVTNADIVAQGVAQGEDYTYNKFEAIKWFQCPGTGKWSIYAKRLNSNASGQIDYVNGKQLFGATVTAPNGEVDSIYDAVRIDYPYGNASGDLGDIRVDGKAYIISTGRDDHTIRFIELTQNCSDIVNADIAGAEPAKTLQWYYPDGTPEPREAPSIFYHNGYYYMMTSGATGWRPNQQKYAYASSFLGDWSEMIPIGDRTAYHSQIFWVKGVNATDGSGNKAKLFSGTRNAQVWNGWDNRDVITPMYFNTPEKLATNHYDYVDINYTTAEVTGGRYDHGTRLPVQSINLEGYAEDVSAMIDGDQTTAWFKGNVSGQDVILYDLGEAHLVRALKVKQYDALASAFPGEVERKVFRMRVEVGDGVNYTKVFDDEIVPSISWLHTLDLTDTTGQFVRITRLETHNGGSTAVQKDFGFYETELWGNVAEPNAQVSDGFESDIVGQQPANWSIYTPSNIQVSVASDATHGNVLELVDNRVNETAYVKQDITPQSGSNLELLFDFKFNTVGGGEKLRLRQGNTVALEIRNSELVYGLAIADTNTEHTKIADIYANTWYQVKVILSTDSNSYDVYLDNQLVWGGATFRTPVTSIDTVFLGTGWTQSGTTGYFDNISFAGPISDPPASPPSLPSFFDDFESGTGTWLLSKGTWSIAPDGGNNVIRKTDTTGSGYISNGDTSWTDYTVSADVQRNGQQAAVLGRYQASNRYYQLAIKDNGMFVLNVNFNGSWTKLADGVFANDIYTYYQLKMQFVGDQITAFINNQQVASVTDSKIADGKIGLRSQNGAANFDNVNVY